MKEPYKPPLLKGTADQAAASIVAAVRRHYSVEKTPRIEHEATKERLTRTLKDVVRFQTIDDGEHAEAFQGLFAYVDQKVRETTEQTGRAYWVRDWENEGRISRIITPVDDGRSEEEALHHPKMAMLIHADVVKAEDPAMFKPEQQGNILVGRGVYDMKQGLAIGLDLLGQMPKGAALIITSDEENGGQHGATYLAKEVGVRPDFLIILDGQKAEHLSFGGKAIWQTKITFGSLLNTGGHGSRREDYSAISLGRDLDNALEQAYPWELDNSPQGVTYNVGEFHGGVATNKIAEHAECKVDMRFPTEEEKMQGKVTLQTVLEGIVSKKLHEIYGEKLPVVVTAGNQERNGKEVFVVEVENPVSGQRYDVITCETIAEYPLYGIDPTNATVQRFKTIVEDITGRQAAINPRDTGGNDGTNWPDVPAVLYMPRGGGAHMSSEWVDMESVTQTREAIGQLMEESLSQQ